MWTTVTNCNIAAQTIADGVNYCAWVNSQVTAVCGRSPEYAVFHYSTVVKDDGYGFIYVSCIAETCNGSEAPYANSSWPYRVAATCLEENNKEETLNLIVKQNSTNNQNSCSSSGSIILNSNQVVGEIIPLTGLDFGLSHFSNRVKGRVSDYKTTFDVDTDKLTSSVQSVTFQVKDLEGNEFFQRNYTRGTQDNFSFVWDGVAANGSETWGSEKFKVIYKTSTTGNAIADQVYDLSLGGFKAKKLGLGGWVPTIWHFYDHKAEKMYLGDGNFKYVKAILDSGLYRVASSNGNEVYYFDSLGRIVKTKTGLTGSVKYSYNYNDAGNLISIVDSFNRVTKFNYDQSGKITEIVTPTNIRIKLTLVNGLLTTVENPKNEKYLMEYKSIDGLLSKFTKPNGVFAQFYYDSDGNLTRDLNSSGQESNLVKTSSGVKTTTAMGRVFENNYDPIKKEEIYISPTGLQTTYTNSESETKVENVISITKSNLVNDPRFGDQVKNYSTTAINNFGIKEVVENNVAELLDTSNIFAIDSLTKTVTEGQSVINATYDGITRTHTISTSEGRQIATQVNSLERPILSQVGSTLPTKFNYQNELLTSISQSDRKTEFFYNPNNKLLMSVKNAEGQKINFLYDDAQRLKAKQLPDGRVIQYQYDSNNNLVSITPPSRPTHVMNFGANELISSYNPPSLIGIANVNTQYNYNKDKDLIKVTRPDGEVINYNWNQATGLLDSITGSFGTISRQYQNEQLTKIIDQNGLVANFSYTGKVVTGLSILDSTQREVYSFGRNSSSQFPGLVGSESIKVGNSTQSIDFEYDKDKVLIRAGDLHLEYNSPNGQLVKTTLDNIKEYFTYNKVGEVKSYSAKIVKNNKEETIYSYRLDRDKLGRIIKKVERYSDEKEKKHHREKNEKDSIETEYVYDKAGRLIHVHGDRRNSNYVYDQNSNRIHGHAGNEPFNGIYDNQDRLIRFNNTTFSYNANGDMISKAEQVKCDAKSKKPTYETTSIQYDVFGNLKQYGKVSYKIDPLNKRLSRSVNGMLTNMYAYNPEEQMIAELDKDANLSKYFIYGSKNHVPDYFVDNTNTKFKIITDHLGSVRLVVNAQTGEVKEKMNHDEFGKVLTDSNPNYIPFGFAGGIYDSETKLVRFGVRDYDAKVGRWTSKDPIRFDAKDSNLYGYTFNDPINRIDSTGLSQALVNENGSSEGYVDLSGSIGVGLIFTGGIQHGSGLTCIYAGGGVGTGPAGVSLNFTNKGSPSSEPSGCLSGGAGVGGSVSASNSGISSGYGVTTPGVSLVVTGTLICF